MSRAQAMAQRAREAAGESPEDSARKLGWLKLLLVAGGIGMAAAWITSPTRRPHEDRDHEDHDGHGHDRDEREHDEREHDEREHDEREQYQRHDDERRPKICSCNRSLPDARDRDDDREKRGERDDRHEHGERREHGERA